MPTVCFGSRAADLPFKFWMTAVGAERKLMFEIGGFRFCPFSNLAGTVPNGSVGWIADLCEPSSSC